MNIKIPLSEGDIEMVSRINLPFLICIDRGVDALKLEVIAEDPFYCKSSEEGGPLVLLEK